MPLIIKLVRAKIFCCDVSSEEVPLNPSFKACCFNSASVMEIPKRLTASWFPTIAEVKA